MCGFSSIQGQAAAIACLKRRIRQARVPNAFLFTGPDGVGKRTTAISLALALNCESPGDDFEACGKCRTCRRISNNTHADILTIAPVDDTIGIDRVRALDSSLGMKVLAARKRLVIMDQAHLMTVPAGNALLKKLEEPPPDTHFVLISTGTSDMLPTILSRSQRVRFAPLCADVIVAILTGRHGLPETLAAECAGLANGRLARAMELSRPDLVSRRRWLWDILIRLPRMSVAQRSAAAAVMAEDKRFFVEDLNQVTIWLRNILIARWTPGRILNPAQQVQMRQLAREIPVKNLLPAMETVQQSLKRLNASQNPRVIAETLLAKLVNTLDPAPAN